MNKKKQTLLNMSAYVLAPFVIGIGNIFKMKIFIDETGALQNGLYQFYFACLIYFEIAEQSMDMSLYAPLYEYIVQQKYEKINALIAGARVYWFRFGIGYILIALLFLPLAPLLVGQNPSLFFVLAMYILYIIRGTFTYWFSGPQTVALADNRGYLVITFNACMTLIGALGAIVIVYATHNLLYAVFFEVLITCIFILVKYVYLKKKFSFLDMHYPKKKSFAFTKLLPSTLTTKITDTLINNSDIFLVTILFGASENSSFAIFMSFAALLINVFGTSVMSSMQSLLGKYFAETAHDKKTKKQSIRLLKWFNYAVIAIVLPLIALALNPFIGWFYGIEQTANFMFYLILLIFIYVRLFRTPYTTLKVSTGHYKTFVPFAIADSMLKVILSIIFARMLGVYGVFLGTIISYIVTELWLEAREFDIKILHQKWFVYVFEVFAHFVLTVGISMALYHFVSPFITDIVSLIGICFGVGIMLVIGVIGVSVICSHEVRDFIGTTLKQKPKI